MQEHNGKMSVLFRKFWIIFLKKNMLLNNLVCNINYCLIIKRIFLSINTVKICTLFMYACVSICGLFNEPTNPCIYFVLI